MVNKKISSAKKSLLRLKQILMQALITIVIPIDLLSLKSYNHCTICLNKSKEKEEMSLIRITLMQCILLTRSD